MTLMKIIIGIILAASFIFLIAVSIKKNKEQKEDVDDLSPTKCKGNKEKD